MDLSVRAALRGLKSRALHGLGQRLTLDLPEADAFQRRQGLGGIVLTQEPVEEFFHREAGHIEPFDPGPQLHVPRPGYVARIARTSAEIDTGGS